MKSQVQCSPREAVRLFAAELLAAPAQVTSTPRGGALEHGLAQHWPEYLIEAGCLGLFMLSACAVTVIVEHPASLIRTTVHDAGVRRFVVGLAMGLTAIALIYSPIGRRSGGHMNPAITLTFWRLGKIEPFDATFYIVAQFIGGVAGTALAFVLFRSALVHPQVNFAATMPGMLGALAALAGEIAISFLMMSVVLMLSNSAKYARYTGIAAGVLVMLFITFEAPISGMSMNPARSFASDFVGMQWNAIWVYFAGPLAGMLAAAEVYVSNRGRQSVICAKLDHSGEARCIFRCGYMETQAKAHTA